MINVNIEEKRFRGYIKNVRGQFAKTYADTWPHEYTVRDWRSDIDGEFAWAVQYIRNHGTTEKFFEDTYIYLYLDGLKYWTMGEPIDETTVINRAVVKIAKEKTNDCKSMKQSPPPTAGQ